MWMAQLGATPAVAPGAQNALATATAIRLFFMRSPFLIGLSRSGALTRPPLRRHVSCAVDLTSPGKERSCRDSAKTQHLGASYLPADKPLFACYVAHLQHRTAQKGQV